MLLFEYSMGSKFGDEWLAKNAVRPFSELTQESDTDSVLLVWHGPPIGPDGERLTSMLRTIKSLWVLFVSSGPAPEEWREMVRQGPDRVCLLKYGLKNVDTERANAWNQQPSWVLHRFEPFVRTVKGQVSGSPPWDMLIASVAPEHVIACYLCCLAQVAPQASWKSAFEEEVGYWQMETKIRLEWDSDRAAQQKLREFLLAAGASSKGAVGGVVRDGST